MAEKVRVSREVAKAIDYVIEVHGAELALDFHARVLIGDMVPWQGEEWKALNSLSLVDFAKVMFVGYEIEQTPEEILLCEYAEGLRIGAGHRTHANAIKFTLDTLNIKIKGINE